MKTLKKDLKSSILLTVWIFFSAAPTAQNSPELIIRFIDSCITWSVVPYLGGFYYYNNSIQLLLILFHLQAHQEAALARFGLSPRLAFLCRFFNASKRCEAAEVPSLFTAFEQAAHYYCGLTATSIQCVLFGAASFPSSWVEFLFCFPFSLLMQV